MPSIERAIARRKAERERPQGHTVYVRVSPDIYQRLSATAKRYGVKLSTVVHLLLEDWAKAEARRESKTKAADDGDG